MPRARIALGLVLAVSVLGVAGCGGGGDEAATATTETTTAPSGSTLGGLKGSVGPGFEISLTTAEGTPVDTLSAGTYTVEVDDQSDQHNFHLTGPGSVDQDSGVSETGTSTWTVTFEAGSYHFQCDPHSSQMSGDFEVTG